MKLITTEEEIKSLKSNDFVYYYCDNCDKVSCQRKREFVRSKAQKFKARFCSPKCYGAFYKTSQEVECFRCKKKITKRQKDLKKTKHSFCSHSCSVLYSNSNKTQGYRRSKIELYLEKELAKEYPTIQILHNNTKTFRTEIDIYIPQLKAAIELNGIFHYKPIFGAKKFERVKINDALKLDRTKEHGVELLVIDISRLAFDKVRDFQKVHRQVKCFIDFCRFFD